MTDTGLPSPNLALAIAPVALEGPARERFAEAVAWCASTGLRSVTLDGMMRGMRPRDLDRSSRREVASILRRQGLVCTGLDLWIPPEHYLDPSRADRAISAALESIRFLAEVAPLTRGEFAPSDAREVLSVTLPVEGAHADLRAELAECGAAHGVRLADHTWPASWAEGFEHDHMGIGIDPATVLLDPEGPSPARALARHAPSIVSARLTDTDGAARVVAGEGRLDVFEYVATVVTCGVASPIVVDARDLGAPRVAAARMIDAAGGGPV